MKHKLSITLSLVVLTVALIATNARGQTVANGPYYAWPSWDQTLPVATRFIVLSNMGSNAVLDRETGLVWERSPSTSTFKWDFALNQCKNSQVGNRRGWRLPTVQDLSSLLDGDPANTNSPRLPPGHPFIGVQSYFYWTGTTSLFASDARWVISLDSGFVLGPVVTSTLLNVWCVRGGQAADAQ